MNKHPLADCDNCPLQDTTGVAHGSGPTDAKVVFVGEAPGFNEMQGGAPFIGQSGKLLDTVLAHHGIDRRSIRLTNACLCRPAGNATPPPEAVRACKPRLDAELAGAETIVAMGNTAATAILGYKTKITQERVGPPKLNKAGQRVIPTVHPAATLRVPDMFPHFVSDLGKVKLVDADTGWTEPVFRSFEDTQSALAVLGQLIRSSHPVVALDIEVGVDKDESFTHPKQLLCIGLSYAKNKAIVIGEEPLKSERVLRAINELCRKKKILCHNGKFDLQVLYNMGVLRDPRLYADTMLASYCLDERPGTHGLKYLAKELLGAPAYDDELHRYIGRGESFAVVPRDVLYKYNAYDAALTFNLWTIFEPQLEAEDLRGLHDFLCAASDALLYVESGGLGIDLDYNVELTNEYLDKLDELEERLVELSREGFNPRSPKQVKEILASKGWKVVSTNEDTLRELQARAGGDAREFLDLMLEHRRTAKLYGTYIKGIRKRATKDRVYPTLLLHGTTTGRLACRNPNLQNVPRESTIRRQFVPDAGNVFVQADYKAAELRVIACEAQDEYLRSVFAEGRDLHSEIATQFFGPDFTKDQRVRAKAVVFGLSYGRESYGLAQEFGITTQEAQEYIDKFFAVIPQVAEWRKWIADQVLKQNKNLTTAFGRQRRFWLITRDNQKDVLKEAYAFIPQSTASDINLAALMQLQKDGFAVRIAVHDSIMVECKEDEAKDVAEHMAKVMKATALERYSDFVPFDVDYEIGKSWGELDD